MSRIIVISFIYFVGHGHLSSRVDSTWEVSLLALYLTDVASSSDAPLSLSVATIKLKDNKNTILLDGTTKSFFGEQDLQVGIEYYRRLKSSYLNIGLHKSSGDLFPTWVSVFNYNLTLKKGIAAAAGARYYNYKSGASLLLMTLGMDFYISDWMGSYRYSSIPGESGYHRVTMRKAIFGRGYAELSVGRGLTDVVQLGQDFGQNTTSRYDANFYMPIGDDWMISVGQSLTKSAIYNKHYYNYSLGLEYTF